MGRTDYKVPKAHHSYHKGQVISQKKRTQKGEGKVQNIDQLQKGSMTYTNTY